MYRDDDKEFDDSESNDGDDVFIGVENQDDFKGYKDRYDVSFKNDWLWDVQHMKALKKVVWIFYVLQYFLGCTILI